MEILYMLIAFSLVLAVFFLVLFLRAVRSGQYDDGVTPAMRMLFDDDVIRQRHAQQGRGYRHTPGPTKQEEAAKNESIEHTIINR